VNSGVYIITNIVTNKYYIGSTINNIEDRLKGHYTDLLRNNHINSHLQYSFNKYGKDNFLFEVLEYHESLYCISMEQYWMNMLDVCNSKYGYNILPVANRGRGGIKHTQESKDKMSLKRIGKKLSKEHIKSRSESRSIPVNQYSLDELLIKEWQSATIAAKELKLFKGNLINCCKNKVKTCGKFKSQSFNLLEAIPVIPTPIKASFSVL